MTSPSAVAPALSTNCTQRAMSLAVEQTEAAGPTSPTPLQDRHKVGDVTSRQSSPSAAKLVTKHYYFQCKAVVALLEECCVAEPI